MHNLNITKIKNIPGRLDSCNLSKKILKQIKNWSIFKIDFSRFKTILVVLSFVFFVVYLIQVNSLATAGFKIEKLEQNIQQLEKNNKQLQFSALDLQSINRVEAKSQELNMVSLDKIDYLTPTSGSIVASK